MNKFTNNARSSLAVALAPDGVNITVLPAEGARFPTLSGGGDYFLCTLIRADGTGREIVKATARVGDILTVTRAQEGTAAGDFPAGTYIALQATSATYNKVYELDGKVIQYAPTKAAADSLAAGLGDGATVIVDDDETQSGARVRYTVASGMLISPVTDTPIVAVDSVADLLALSVWQRNEGFRYLVKGYHAGSDVGGGEFYWIETPTRSQNLITHFNSPFSGQYVRRLTGELTAHMAGAVGDGVADDTAALQRFINYEGGELPVGYYRITDTLRIASNSRARFYGVGGTSEAPRALQYSPPYSHTVISWDGAQDGVILDVSQNAFPTPVTGYSGIGLYVANLTLSGNGVAGIGLNSNGATNSSKFDSITATGCTLFGVLINRSWFASYSRITAQGCSGIGIAVGYNFEGSIGSGIAVNGVNMTDFRAHSCGASAAENPRVGYDGATQPWGGCGIYLGRSFNASTVINRMQVENCHGNAVVIEMGGYAQDTGIRDNYTESNGGPYDYYIFGDGGGIGTFFIDNTFVARAGGVVEVYNGLSQTNTQVLFSTNTRINRSGPMPVHSDNYSRRTFTSGVSKRIYGGSRIDAKYNDAWIIPGSTSFVTSPEAGLLPGPVRYEETAGSKVFDGYRFNLSRIGSLEAAGGGASLMVSLFINQWTAGSVRQAVTKTYIVNFASQNQYSTKLVADYSITVTELGTGATVGSALITDIAVTGVKISGEEAVLRATYNVTQPPHNSNPNSYGPKVSWSAVSLTGATRVFIEAL